MDVAAKKVSGTKRVSATKKVSATKSPPVVVKRNDWTRDQEVEFKEFHLHLMTTYFPIDRKNVSMCEEIARKFTGENGQARATKFVNYMKWIQWKSRGHVGLLDTTMLGMGSVYMDHIKVGGEEYDLMFQPLSDCLRGDEVALDHKEYREVYPCPVMSLMFPSTEVAPGQKRKREPSDSDESTSGSLVDIDRETAPPMLSPRRRTHKLIHTSETSRTPEHPEYYGTESGWQSTVVRPASPQFITPPTSPPKSSGPGCFFQLGSVFYKNKKDDKSRSTGLVWSRTDYVAVMRIRDKRPFLVVNLRYWHHHIDEIDPVNDGLYLKDRRDDVREPGKEMDAYKGSFIPGHRSLSYAQLHCSLEALLIPNRTLSFWKMITRGSKRHSSCFLPVSTSKEIRSVLANRSLRRRKPTKSAKDSGIHPQVHLRLLQKSKSVHASTKSFNINLVV
ncbi:hypothetical protein K402DRAFT_202423 [Aulographum hederae CBS 113979]|uniref:Uncharacterized protein n=1 Tax=Aulographum hederae CBS 113979 TaxID=1176131 RepID=A0A6G1HCG5_9PEZI|nr:hypothetical protein K402DRAFT_202423 [Aulographum hederae CBS 113979]